MQKIFSNYKHYKKVERVVFVAEHRLERCEMALFANSFVIITALWLKKKAL